MIMYIFKIKKKQQTLAEVQLTQDLQKKFINLIVSFREKKEY